MNRVIRIMTRGKYKVKQHHLTQAKRSVLLNIPKRYWSRIIVRYKCCYCACLQHEINTIADCRVLSIAVLKEIISVLVQRRQWLRKTTPRVNKVKLIMNWKVNLTIGMLNCSTAKRGGSFKLRRIHMKIITFCHPEISIFHNI